jgi:hypothetical protein
MSFAGVLDSPERGQLKDTFETPFLSCKLDV